MNSADLRKAIDWLKEYVNRMKDREDYDVLKDNILALERTVRDLEDQIDAL
jgi:polyhydroxyalkanoate synthesis regulator phasin